jgi:hypothetical protein
MSKEDEAYTQGGRHALVRAARFARKADKNRSFEWLMTCADIWEKEGFGGQWPDAPAYKGAVVHIEAPGPDLKALTDDELIALSIAIDGERFERDHG